MRAIFVLFLAVMFSTVSYAQKKTSINDIRNIYDEKGDYYYDQKEYKKAIVYYNMAYKKDAKNYYSVLRKAEAFSALELYDQAAESYRIVFEQDLYIPNEHRLQFAFLLLRNKDISGFEKWMANYNEIVASEISGYISSSAARAKMYKDSTIIVVENESVLNTPESEIAAAVIGDKVVFASTRKNLAGNSANSFYNMYSATYISAGRLGRLNTFNNSINTSKNESAAAVNKSANKLYFTRGASATSGLTTYTSSIPKSKDEKLSASEFTISGFGSVAHPTFNKAGTKMFFVSNASGGSGGYDIYVSELVGGKWAQPSNLGAAVNTSKDEMYPQLVNDTLLYFSSAGHNGLGGLDLYVLNLKRENSSPNNLGSKINSQYNDYALTFSEEGLTGYFASDRPGGFGKEDIYRVHILDLKVKYAAYRFKRKTFMEDDKINLYLSDGEEHNIASEDKTGFNFGFQPEESYKMVIQHENALASDIIYNTKLSTAQKKAAFLAPSPIQKTEIQLQPGMRYQFTAGMQPLSNSYKSAIKEMSSEYQNPGSSIDLTALAKELLLKEGEVYTIRFVKDDDHPSAKSKEATNLFINNGEIDVASRSFFIMLPLDIEANFNIKTDIDHFKETFSPKKVGAVSVDAEPVLKEEPVKLPDGFPILVNTTNMTQVSKKKIKATELTIIPGSVYILTLGKTIPETGDKLEIVVPLTKGVKYNLGTAGQSKAEYDKAISQMGATKATAGENSELIDISVLSKELDMVASDDIVLNLMPAQKFGNQPAARSVVTTLDVDGRKYFITNQHRLQVNLKLPENQKMNIQTDLSYVKENFDASTIALNVDTSSFTSNIKEKEKDIITDPVFDKVVVNFDLNDYSIRTDAKSILADKVINVLKGDSRLYVTIKGYTDGLGNAEHNKKLSSDRAHAVKDFLSNNGIGESRIRTFSFGESLALDAGTKWEDLSEAELQKHRKVEIVIYLPK